MQVYTIHRPPQEPPWSQDPSDVVVVREGYSWGAFLAGPIWALFCGMWPLTLGHVAGLMLGAAAVRWLALGELFEAAALIAYQLLFALIADDLWRWWLSRRGFREAGVIVAPDAVTAAAAFALKQAEAAAAPAPDGVAPPMPPSAPPPGAQPLSPFASPFEPS